MTDGAGPLAGSIVLDVSRMLPGAVLARRLLALGAHVLKIEDPAGGDPMRNLPPYVDGVGIGFGTFYAGAETLASDLRDAAGAAAFRELARRADVVVESFRPGTMDAWGLGYGALSARNAGLVYCSLPAFRSTSARAGEPAHDLNVLAESGLLDAFGGAVPGVQVVDVSTGLAAATEILAALFARERTGRGARIEVPLAEAPEPYLAWALAERRLGAAEVTSLLGGTRPAYGVYACSDGERVAIGALEPKFWAGVCEMTGLVEFAGDGLDASARGRAARERLASRFRERPASEWLAAARERGLPLTRVARLDEAVRSSPGSP